MDFLKEELILKAGKFGHVPKLGHSSDDRTRKLPQRMAEKSIDYNTILP
jgi:hypothetical protein